ncbi:hypothetical protein K9L63_00770, partial [Candidatus Gracilibacteria bacterium]|nr:hypothetical protein [Candidatus Gracilibacteria bacterium]
YLFLHMLNLHYSLSQILVADNPSNMPSPLLSTFLFIMTNYFELAIFPSVRNGRTYGGGSGAARREAVLLADGMEEVANVQRGTS